MKRQSSHITLECLLQDMPVPICHPSLSVFRTSSVHNDVNDKGIWLAGCQETMPRSGVGSGKHSRSKNNRQKHVDVGLIRTDAPKGTRFLVLRIRPLCHHA